MLIDFSRILLVKENVNQSCVLTLHLRLICCNSKAAAASRIKIVVIDLHAIVLKMGLSAAICVLAEKVAKIFRKEVELDDSEDLSF